MAVSYAERGRERMYNDLGTVFESVILVRDQILARTTLHQSEWHYSILNKQSTSTEYHTDPLRERYLRHALEQLLLPQHGNQLVSLHQSF